MKKIQYLLFIILAVHFSIANATLSIEIRGGQAVGLPIAVVPFGLDGVDEKQAGTLSRVIGQDLGNSGQFSVSPLRLLSSFPTESKAVKFSAWKKSGVENLVVGKIEKTGLSKYTVSFELLDVIGQYGKGVTDASVLLSMRFDNIKADEFRGLAHHISDLIFERLIGVKGFFSTRIAYVSVVQNRKTMTQTLEVADFDGHNAKPLYRSKHPLMSPSWSPDGKHIAFVSFEKERSGIYISDVLTGRVKRVTQFPGINGAPAWSPDGKTLALVLSKGGMPKIYTLNLENKQLTRLTSGGGRDTEPSFTPDGRFILFTSDRGGRPQIYRVPLNKGKVERITFTGIYNAKPSVTPDGNRLITLHRGASGGLFGIAVQHLKTGEVKVLTETGLNDSPCLSPNGMMVLYGSGDGSREILSAVSLDGRTQIRLPLKEGSVKDPAWSPFTTKY